MNRTSRTLALAFLPLLFAIGLALAKSNDKLDLRIPPGWKIGNQQENRQSQMVRIQLIREGDDIQNWKELLTELSGRRPSNARTAEDILDIFKAQEEKDCPGLTVWNVIEKDENSVTYETQAQPCQGKPEQIKIAKILYGKYTFYLVQYEKKVKELPPDERDTWLKWFGDVKLTSMH